MRITKEQVEGLLAGGFDEGWDTYLIEHRKEIRGNDNCRVHEIVFSVRHTISPICFYRFKLESAGGRMLLRDVDAEDVEPVDDTLTEWRRHMDHNENLKQTRETTAALERAIEANEVGMAFELAEKLIELNRGMDQWLVMGGALPEDWDR